MQSQYAESTVITVSGLHKHFRDIRAVDGIDMELKQGRITAILGPNGAGKSTTIKILEGLLKRDEGEVRILGRDPWNEHDKVKMQIGVMPQDFNFFEQLNPVEAVTLFSSLFSRPVNPDDLLKLVLLHDSARVKFENLSGGQKQKLGLALALVNDPAILFLDEPTTGLDPTARRTIWSVIRSFREHGKSVVLTTHYLEEAEQLADYVYIIDHGKIVAEGTPGDIVERYGSGRKLILKAAETMHAVLLKHGVNARKKNGFIEIPLAGDKRLSELISIIENSGIEYEQLVVRADSLEDIFVRLVGTMVEGDLA